MACRHSPEWRPFELGLVGGVAVLGLCEPGDHVAGDVLVLGRPVADRAELGSPADGALLQVIVGVVWVLALETASTRHDAEHAEEKATDGGVEDLGALWALAAGLPNEPG